MPRLQMNVQDPQTLPLADIDVSQAELYEHDLQDTFFRRLRDESPVHYCRDSQFGPYWSVTRFDDIVEVEKDFHTFSSYPTILLSDQPEDFELVSFIAMDPPQHDVHRMAVQGAVAPANLALLEPVIRSRVGQILDSLPVGPTFDWVDRVSIELTTQMLATLFDFPFEQRRRLTRWSDVAIATPELTGSALVTEEQRRAELGECLATFVGMWQERAAHKPGNDLISMLAHSPATRDLPSRPMEYLGTLLLLIVGGNDTTRNSISGGVIALNRNPGEYDKLRANPALIPNMVSEIIRWQTPVLHMRRRATRDVEFGGKTIRKDERVVMWYISGNRDDRAIEHPGEFRIDRPKARHHLSFGFGIHRCMGNRLGELQLRITWEELTKRFKFVEMMGEPVRTRSNFIRGITQLPVRLHPL
jgi:cytochrome P450